MVMSSRTIMFEREDKPQPSTVSVRPSRLPFEKAIFVKCKLRIDCCIFLCVEILTGLSLTRVEKDWIVWALFLTSSLYQNPWPISARSHHSSNYLEPSNAYAQIVAPLPVFRQSSSTSCLDADQTGSGWAGYFQTVYAYHGKS